MSHEIAKLLLEKAHTFLDRAEAVRTALQLGMTKREIEDYLDWLDMLPDRTTDADQRKDNNGSAE
jgi:hypothetical protein